MSGASPERPGAGSPRPAGEDEAVLGTVLLNQRALRQGPVPEEDPDLALAKMLQMQEQAWLAMAGGGSGALENMPLGGGAIAGSSSGAAAGAEGAGGEAGEEGGEELTDEEMARRLQEQEEREFQARLLALAGVGPAGSGGGTAGAASGGGGGEGEEEEEDVGAGGEGEEGYVTEDDVDPDELTYEELTALGEAVGTVSRGIGEADIEALPTSSYREVTAAGQAPQEEEECCPICRVEFEPDDTVRVLPLCRHFYHPDCIAEWLRRNKVCCLCNKEVLEEKKQKKEGTPAPGAAGGGGSSSTATAPLGERRRQ